MTEQVFVARERELAQLDGFLEQALAGHGQICFVTGEAGAGKTALVTEFARRAQAQHDDLLVAIGNCNAQSGIGDPYLPFREVLGLLTGDVETKLAQGAITAENAGRLQNFLRISGQALIDLGPDLIEIFVPGAALATRAGTFVAGKVGWLDRLDQVVEKKAQAEDAELEQHYIFEQYTAVLKALAAARPLILVVDDLQWADAASISLLFHLGRRIENSRILLAGAYRPGDVALGRAGRAGQTERHPLDSVLNELKRYYGDVWIDLDQAEEDAGREFIETFLDTQPNRLGEDFRTALFQRTHGQPLFTIELLRAMQERGDLVHDADGYWIESSTLDWQRLPARVEGVIEERIGRLAEELRETLTVASVEGEDFTAQVVARVREADERSLVRQLSRDLEKRHRLVGERGIRRLGRQRLSLYRFQHNLFRRYLYDSLGEVERAYLHEDVGNVLETLYAGRLDEIVPQLAWHFAEAGQGEKAVKYLLQAGDRARAIYALNEAAEHYQRALVFLKEQGDFDGAARTLMKLGLTYHNAFDFPRARQAYEEGFVLWQQSGERRPATTLPADRQTLRVDRPYPPTTLDPTLARDAVSSSVIEQLFSGLVQLTPELEVVPDVAYSWEVSEGGRTYIFRLRNDVVWSDGKVVTAQDFEYAWKRVLDPAAGSPNASLLYDVKHARAFHQGDLADPDQVGVRSRGEDTLIVELERPTSYFPQLLAYRVSYPIPRHAVEAYGSTWTEAGNIVTNGPFELETWSPGESMILVRNPDYHGRFGGNVDRVEMFLTPDPPAKLEMYEAGDLDTLHLWGLPILDRDRARQRHAGEYVTAPALVTWFLGFDVSRPPFDDPRARRALALTIDKEHLTGVILRGYSFPATGGLIPPGMPGHSPQIGLDCDPGQAKQLLAAAGFPAGQSFPSIQGLRFRGHEAEAEHLRTTWQANLGIDVTWEAGTEWEAFLKKLETDPPAIFFSGWQADYPDPDNFLRVGLQWHHTSWYDETYHTLVEEARQLTDQNARLKRYQQADRILIEAGAIVPLINTRQHLLVKPRIKHYPISALKHWFWKDVVIEPGHSGVT